jgi:sugar phosphate isomerase/epimerase
MTSIPRRKFLQYSSGLFALGLTDVEMFAKKKTPLLSFSTLGCPDWSLEQILAFAREHKFAGIEIRGIQRELDLTKSKHFNTPTAISETRTLLKDKNIRIVGLGSSAAMHHSAAADREKSFDEARRFIDLASKVDCPYVRVLPDKLPKEGDKTGTLKLITEGLLAMADHCKGSGVSVLMETHGDVVRVDDIETVMKGVGSHPNAGLVWDISNMWTITKETPAEVYPRLKKWIRHTHLKDLKEVEGKDQYTLLSMGEVPVFEAVDLLTKGGYKGFYSFEWEKLWHPEIEEPDVAIAQYSSKMREHFGKKERS